jgi:hypothetical protein
MSVQITSHQEIHRVPSQLSPDGRLCQELVPLLRSQQDLATLEACLDFATWWCWNPIPLPPGVNNGTSPVWRTQATKGRSQHNPGNMLIGRAPRRVTRLKTYYPHTREYAWVDKRTIWFWMVLNGSVRMVLKEGSDRTIQNHSEPYWRGKSRPLTHYYGEKPTFVALATNFVVTRQRHQHSGGTMIN